MNKTAWSSEVQDRDEQYRLKRLALLRTAAQAFNESGFHQTSLNDLAKRLNVTKPTLYHYIKNKDEILLACQQMALDRMQEVLYNVENSGENGLEKIKLFMRRYAEVVVEDFGICMVMSGDLPLETESREIIAEQRGVLDGAIRNLIRQGIADGSITSCDPRLATFALFGAFNWITHWYRGEGKLRPRQIADQFLDLFEHGLSARVPAPDHT